MIRSRKKRFRFEMGLNPLCRIETQSPTRASWSNTVIVKSETIVRSSCVIIFLNLRYFILSLWLVTIVQIRTMMVLALLLEITRPCKIVGME